MSVTQPVLVDLGLTNKAALVMAASKGLGNGIATGLSRAGARVAIASRDEARIAAAAAVMHAASGYEVVPIVADATRAADMERAVASTVSHFGQLDILVTNAGGPPPGRFDDLDEAAWDTALELSLMSVIRLIRTALPHLRARKDAGGGRIINVVSTSAKQPIGGLMTSNVMRAGVLGLAKTLADELAVDGILVNNIAPGRIATDRLIQLDADRARRTGTTSEEVQAQILAGIPLGRYGRVDEFANVAVFLASQWASYVTGTTIQVDGGMVRGLY